MALDIHDLREGSAAAGKLSLSSLQPASSTFQRTTVIHSGMSTSDTWAVLIADTGINEEEEEREWHTIVNKPHVREALRSMAAEARQRYYAGEIEEGGFAVE